MAIKSETSGHPGQVNGVSRVPYPRVDVPAVVKTFPQGSSSHPVAGKPVTGVGFLTRGSGSQLVMLRVSSSQMLMQEATQ